MRAAFDVRVLAHSAPIKLHLSWFHYETGTRVGERFALCLSKVAGTIELATSRLQDRISSAFAIR